MPEPILTLEAIGLKTGTGWLFQQLSLTLDARDRVALIGRNGAGKSTLLKIIDGTIEADTGRRAVAGGLKIGRLEQDPPMTEFATLAEYATSGGAEPHELAALADQLGLDLNRPAATASGGERRRAALVRVLAEAPDLLLLDEPTNHLDISAIEWLENWLDRSRCALVVISHDRTFLTRLTRNCLWLDRGALRRAEVGFGGFDAWADAVAAEEERTAQRLDTKLRAEEHWLQRGVTARRKRNMGRLAKLMDLRETRRSLATGPTTARIATESSDPGSKILIDAKSISLSFGDRVMLKDFSLRVRKGDRIGIIGPNGAGKSTLIKLLLGQVAPDSGSINRSVALAPTIIDQHRQRLKGRTVREVLADGGEWLEVNGSKKHVAGHLKDYLFDAGILDAAAETLSGGEQSRLLLAREFATPSNLMVLDEPTNDLDMETLDLIEEVIGDYDGTVLLVSHDRAFLDRVVNDDRRARWRRQGRSQRWRLERLVPAPGGSSDRRETAISHPCPGRLCAPEIQQAQLQGCPRTGRAAGPDRSAEQGYCRPRNCIGRSRSLREKPGALCRPEQRTGPPARPIGNSRTALAGAGRTGRAAGWLNRPPHQYIVHRHAIHADRIGINGIRAKAASQVERNRGGVGDGHAQFQGFDLPLRERQHRFHQLPPHAVAAPIGRHIHAHQAAAMTMFAPDFNRERSSADQRRAAKRPKGAAPLQPLLPMRQRPGRFFIGITAKGLGMFAQALQAQAAIGRHIRRGKPTDDHPRIRQLQRPAAPTVQYGAAAPRAGAPAPRGRCRGRAQILPAPGRCCSATCCR